MDELAKVEAMVAEGTPFEQVETAIESYALPSGCKSALWLYAFAEQPREARRAITVETMAALV